MPARSFVSWILALALMLVATDGAGAKSRPYLDAARGAAAWLEAHSVHEPNGVGWAPAPELDSGIDDSLYSGTPGVVLFLFEYGRTQHDAPATALARAGADHLVDVARTIDEPGLYDGLAGVAYVLAIAARTTGETRYRDAAVAATRRIVALAKPAGRGVEWTTTTDIITGGAGTGLYLLWAAKELSLPEAERTAVDAGRRLLELGIGEGDGKKWAMDPDFPRLMPNFSHGTAGVAYFLATLAERTGDRSFLDGAIAGARYLESIATVAGDGCLIFHDEPEGKNLYYLSWCHGPAGTARLFVRLFRLTHDKAWLAEAHRLARGVLSTPIPKERTPGLWNNVGQCCGDVGVAEFFLAFGLETGEKRYVRFAHELAASVLARATHDAGGWKWIHAENRKEPEKVAAQTGLMQGAAGIGLWFLRLDAHDRGAVAGFALPDSPF